MTIMMTMIHAAAVIIVTVEPPSRHGGSTAITGHEGCLLPKQCRIAAGQGKGRGRPGVGHGRDGLLGAVQNSPGKAGPIDESRIPGQDSRQCQCQGLAQNNHCLVGSCSSFLSTVTTYIIGPAAL